MHSTVKTLLDFDTSLCLKVNRLSGIKVIDKISYLISRLGDGAIYFLFLGIIIAVFEKSVFDTARDYLSAGAINLLLYKLVKGKVKRKRPFNAIDSITKIISPPDEFSFPSGHSGSAAVFCYMTFFHMPFIIGIVTSVWMLLIGFSRVYNGVHYPGDVVAGYFMGVVVSKIVLIIFYIV